MKKLLLFLAVMLTFASSAFAQTATFDWSGITTTQSPKESNVYTEAPITLTFAKASGSTIPAENKEGSIRMYTGTSLTIDAAEGYLVTAVDFTPTTSSYSASKLTYNGAAISDAWTLATPSQSIVLSATANARFKKIIVTFESANSNLTNAGLSYGEQKDYIAYLGESFTAPVLTNPNNLAVKYASSTPEVASVDESTGVVTLVANGTTTITASSEETDKYYAGSASYTLTVSQKVNSIAEFIAAATTENYPIITINIPVYVIAQNSYTTYVTDGTDYMQVYGAITQQYNHGDVIPAGITGCAQHYIHSNDTEGVGMYELSSPIDATFAASTETVMLNPIEVEYSAITTAMANQYVEISGVKVASGVITVGETTITDVISDKFNVEIPDGENLKLDVIVYNNKGAVQLYPVKVNTEDATLTVDAPVFVTTQGLISLNSKVEISCATTDATIMYSTNGVDFVKYTEPIAFTADMLEKEVTFTAYATKEGMVDSEKVTATYTPTNDQFINLVLPDLNLTDATTISTQTLNGVTIEVAQLPNKNATASKYYKADGIRFYANNTMTLTAPAGYYFKSATYTFSDSKSDAKSIEGFGVDYGYITGDNVWTNDTYNSSYTLTATAQARIKEILLVCAELPEFVASVNKAEVSVKFADAEYESKPIQVNNMTLDVLFVAGADAADLADSFVVKMDDMVLGDATLDASTGEYSFNVEYLPYSETMPEFTVVAVKDGAEVYAEALTVTGWPEILSEKGYVEVSKTAHHLLYNSEEITSETTEIDARAQFEFITENGLAALHNAVENGHTENGSGHYYDLGSPTTFAWIVDQYTVLKVENGSVVVDLAQTYETIYVDATPTFVFKVADKFSPIGLESADGFYLTTVDGQKRTLGATLSNNPTVSGIEGVAVENAPVEYFNLQGIRVANPENGVYIKRQGNKVSKVAF